MLFQTCSKFTFGLSDVFVVTVITRNRISGVGSLFLNDRILRFGKNLPQSLKKFLSNFNIMAIQNSLDVFHNTLNGITVNSPTDQLADGPTRRRIKSSRDVGELVVNPTQIIRS